jgi:hypothetical protein
MFALAAAFRLRVPGFESRYQILIFALFSWLGEGSLAALRQRPFDMKRALIGAVSAAVAILSIKWSTEGLPPVAERLLEDIF